MKTLLILSLVLTSLNLSASYRFDDPNIEIERNKKQSLSLNTTGYKQSLSWEGNIGLDVYNVAPVYVRIPVKVEVCERYNYASAYNYTTKEGKAWADFYGDSAGISGYQISQLADAIKGVDTRASKLYPYFRAGKPSSWSDFKNLISKIENKEKLQGLYATVVNHWGSENRSNLGYNRSTGTSCYEKETGEYNTVFKGTKRTGKIDTIIQNFRVEIEGASYLPGESDLLNVVFNGYNYKGEVLADIDLPRRAYNSFQTTRKYMDSDEVVVFELRAQRNLVKAPNYLLLNDFSYSSRKLNISVQDSSFTTDPDLQSKKSIKIEVWANSDWWNPFDFDDKLTTQIVSLNQNKNATNIDIPISIPKGTEIYLKYSQIIDSSEFYQAGESSTKKTGKKELQ